MGKLFTAGDIDALIGDASVEVTSATEKAPLAQKQVRADKTPRPSKVTSETPAERREASRFEEARSLAAAASVGKPSPHEADIRAKLRVKRPLNFGLCPAFIGEEFSRLASEAGMAKREFLYHLLREAGADIPPYDQLDGRRL